MDLPHFIIEEIFSYLTTEEQSELLTTNKHVCETILKQLMKNLRISYPMADSFYSITLPKFGSQVCSLELGYFSKKLINHLSNVTSITVLENYHDSVEQNIEDILDSYPKLIQLDLSQMLLQFDVASKVLNLQKLVSLQLPDFFSDPTQISLFLNDLVTPSLRSLSLDMPLFSHQIVTIIAKNLPNLTYLSISSEGLYGDHGKMLDVKFQHLKALSLVINGPNIPNDAIDFRLENFPSLTALSFSPLVSFKVPAERTFPLVNELLIYQLDKKLILSTQELFPGLTSLILICKAICPKVVNEALRVATSIESIKLYHVNDQSAFIDLPARQYRCHTFSLLTSCPVQSSFFCWLAPCFPNLHHLSIEFDPDSNASFDAVPFEHQGPFNSLAIFEAAGRFPAIWIHQIIHYSPQLDLLGLDMDLYSKHSRRFSAKYNSLNVVVSFAFDHEDLSSDSESESEFEVDFLSGSDSGSD
ncbi:hypothetical protein DSO57_1014471 [Entomophthora muscae]|uniref:Uncharacterized protein n=1 Tax=Entomophthora muscae TaxID=34485 RepID=A0ACC2RWM9_9FUNG|nr:hypothetical protein DSO57_1014471 [Entomophthora muscae]